MKIDLIPATRQTVWKWPAAANFVLGGAGSALYLIDSLLVSAKPTVFSQADSSSRQIIAIALVALGFLSVSIEAGRPLRAGHALRRWASTWMSREMVFGCGFLVLALLNLLLSNLLLRISAVLLASGIIVSQSFILYSARSVPAWHTGLMLPMSFASSFHCSYGIFIIFSSITAKTDGIVLFIGMLLNIVNLVIWIGYIKISRKDGLDRIFKYFEHGDSVFVIAVIGHICPLLLLAACVIMKNFGAGMPNVLFVIIGLAMIAGSAVQKAQVILRAGYQAEVWVQIGN